MINPQIQEAGKATQFKPGQSGNPNGRPKGSKNWSTIVQDLLMDENLAEKMLDGMKTKLAVWEHIPNKNGASIIATTMMLKASAGDKQAAEWLRKTGFGDKLDVTTDGESINPDGVASEQNAVLFASFLKNQAGKSDVPKMATPTKTDTPNVAHPKPSPSTASQPVVPATTPQPAVQPQPLNASPLPTTTMQPEATRQPVVMTKPFTRPEATNQPPAPNPAQPLQPLPDQPATATNTVPAPVQPTSHVQPGQVGEVVG